MDSLDSNLHSLILGSLAANLASSSTQDDLELLTDSFASLEPINSNTLNSVLARLNDNENGSILPLQAINSQQVDGIVAFARFAGQSTPNESTTARIISLLQGLPNWDIESALGSQGRGASPSDVVSCALVESLLYIVEHNAGDRPTSLAVLNQVQNRLVHDIEEVAGHRIICHILPALNGIRRAIAKTAFTWTSADALPTISTTIASSSSLIKTIATALSQDWAIDAAQARSVRATLQGYESASKGLSPGLAVFCSLDSQEIYLSSQISQGRAAAGNESWERLLTGTRFERTENEGTALLLMEALRIWTSTLASLEGTADLSEGPDILAFDILLKSIRVATLASIAMGVVEGQIFIILEALVSEASGITDETLQIGGIECLQILALAFPLTASRTTSILRKFILSPSSVFEVQGSLSSSSALLAAAKHYSACVDIEDKTGRLPAIQSLLNHLLVTEADPILGTNNHQRPSDAQSFRSTNGRHRSVMQQRLISANVAHVSAAMAISYRDAEITRITILMLLQKLQGHDALVDGAIMFELAQLSAGADVASFGDIVKGVFDVGRRSNDDEVRKTVLMCQSRMAASIADRPELHQVFLVQLLTLFVDIGMQERSSRTAPALLKLIPVLDTFLATAQPDPVSFNPATVALFRSMWHLCVLSGFISSASSVADWKREALVRISTFTPCLIQGTGGNFIETELEFNAILRRSNYSLTADSARVELASALSQPGNTIRSLTTPQTIFLLTILRVESLRAEAGRPATILRYFDHEGINTTLLHPLLVLIANQVCSTFVSTFGDQVTRHSIDPIVYSEVRAILVQCCHQYSRVRKVSLRFFNDLIASFPSLLCDGTVVNVLLELVTVLRRACQSEVIDEYTPVYVYGSLKGEFTLTLPDDYPLRNSILTEFSQFARSWLISAITRAPYELQSLLQNYIDGSTHLGATSTSAPLSEDEMGKSIAIDLVRTLPTNSKEASLPSWGNWKSDNSALFSRTFSTRSAFAITAIKPEASGASVADLNQELLLLSNELREHKIPHKLLDLRSLFYRCAASVIRADNVDPTILHEMVSIPVRILTEGSIAIGLEVWSWVIDARPDLESRVMIEITEAWHYTIQLRRGLFSSAHNRENPLDQETKFTPTNKDGMTQDYLSATRSLQPHSLLLDFLSSRFQAFRYRDPDLVLVMMRLVTRSMTACATWSTHQLARELRMRLISFGFCILQGSRIESAVEFTLRELLYQAALSWFAIRAGWSYGSNRMQMKSDLQAVDELRAAIKSDSPALSFSVTTETASANTMLPGRLTLGMATTLGTNRRHLLMTLLGNEVDRLRLWLNPLADVSRGLVASPRGSISESIWRQTTRIAWSLYPAVAVHLPERFKVDAVSHEVTRLIRSDPGLVVDVPDALAIFVGDNVTPEVRRQLRHLLFWAPVPVISALRFLFPKFGSDPILLQYALRVLEHHPVEVTFFYIPQVVQALRTDALGYAERFIFETSKISQLFCHQIIWNMKANAYRGDAGEEADPMKPTLDRMVEMIVQSLSGEAKDFYEREFAFFDEVTSISAKLKPFIRSTKLEKKAKIDEEMAKIKVDPGVYLPSNPDGVVVDIDRSSGRPLQSHAKAPFMATFKVRRTHSGSTATPILAEDAQDALLDPDVKELDGAQKFEFDTWQSAIFKVGDDCRQDVLALQIIAMHKNVFTALGLDLLVTPYRVTATGPGCGVIDVIPNATSRDEIGRAKVNDLLSYFVLKYGSVDGVRFQKARINFIQSMAAYSLLCYLVQIKDRHNGNIMIDGEGRIIHIDFGFLFDIDKSSSHMGVKFEPGSFKLTHEMVNLMGGRESVGYRMFTELTVKAFLACRPYGQAVVDTASLMLAAEFPSFKGEPTMERLRDRFKLDLTEQEAAEAMKAIIADADTNFRSRVYDEFQLRQGGIPYAK